MRIVHTFIEDLNILEIPGKSNIFIFFPLPEKIEIFSGHGNRVYFILIVFLNTSFLNPENVANH